MHSLLGVCNSRDHVNRFLVFRVTVPHKRLTMLQRIVFLNLTVANMYGISASREIPHEIRGVLDVQGAILYLQCFLAGGYGLE